MSYPASRQANKGKKHNIVDDATDIYLLMVSVCALEKCKCHSMLSNKKASNATQRSMFDTQFDWILFRVVGQVGLC